MKYIKTFEEVGSPDLIIAVKSGNWKNVKKLLDINLDVNCTDRIGWTPLLWATYYGNRNMIKLLINSGADMNHRACGIIKGTGSFTAKKMVDFYDLSVDKEYKKLSKWIEKEYPAFVSTKKYNL